MARNFVLISLVILCILLQSTRAAATFECVDEPAVCKTQFGTQFENGFKDMHLNAIRKLLTTFADICVSIKSELPNDDPFVKAMEDAANTARKNIEKLNNNLDDNKKIAEIIEEAMNDMTYKLEQETDTKNFDKAIEKYDVRKSLSDVIRKLAIDIGNFWAEMYTGLREKDLKTYPEYVEINGLMETLRGNGERPVKVVHYHEIAEILATKFNLPYFETVPEIN